MRIANCKSSRSILILPFGFTIAAFLTGCSNPPISKSKFIADTDLGTIVDRCFAPKDYTLKWGAKGTGAASSGGPGVGHLDSTITFESNFFCRSEDGQAFGLKAEDADRFMRSLKAELEKAVQGSGGTVHDGTETVRDGHLHGFHFQYTEGNARGKIEAALSLEEPKENLRLAKLTIKVDEKATAGGKP